MGDYPSEAELVRIKEWPYEDPDGWFTFIRGCWWHDDWGWNQEDVPDGYDRPVRRYRISTGGWSGNEDIIGAMMENILWNLTWQSSRRGGHYVFEAHKQHGTPGEED